MANLRAWTLQQATEDAMRGRAGAAVIVDVRSGKLLAIANRETAERSLGAPGSAIKPLTLAALLESAALPPTPHFTCPGTLRIAGRNLTCTHPPFPSAPNASTALAYSCNNFFVHFAANLPEGALARTLVRFGINPDNVGHVTTIERRQLQAIGEGEIRVTPMELAEAYRQLALRKLRGDARFAPIFLGLENAVRFGTAQNAKTPSLTIAGKTGTTTGYAWFAGYAPADAPKMAFVVMLRQGTGGGDAAPLARQILAPVVTTDPNSYHIETTEMVLEDYVAGVLAGECGTFSSVEAIKAMAVAARTFAVRFRGRHKEEGFDFCKTSHCQNFRPDGVTARLRDAAETTSGELLWYQGSPASTYYGQDCGGVTEDVQYVWPELRAPYLKQQTDVYCTRLGKQQWNASLSKDELAKALAGAGLGNSFTTAGIASRTPSGRARELQLGGKTVSASSLRFAIGRSLGWNRVRSDFYQIRVEPERVTFTGQGTGHGVGLCQHGADEMGGSGSTYREILAFYYPGTSLGLTASGLRWHMLSAERVELWTTAPEQDRALLGIAEQLVGEAEERTRLRLEMKPRLKVFPSVAIFRDATGEPGWVAASTRGRVIRLQPRANRAAMRHEIYHLLIESRAGKQVPLWFREGLVLALTGGPRSLAGRTPADLDQAIRQTTDIVAARDGYAAARGRVEAYMQRYGEAAVTGWVERGLPPELKNASASQPVITRK
ncbi:MAG: SpoIID/LytB domain-containing protein [Acidobacteriota bacterium]|nr:SpoIID/LytB domain-containing protein [Acidobacteriota bacterium]